MYPCAFWTPHYISVACGDFLIALESTFLEMNQSPLLPAQNEFPVQDVHINLEQHGHEVPYTTDPCILPAKRGKKLSIKILLCQMMAINLTFVNNQKH